MLKADYYTQPNELDQLMFEKLVPAEHYLRKVKAVIDFESMRALVADCYSADMGRGAEDPVLMIKLGFLQFHYGLSDREVLQDAQVNVAFRLFLDLSLDSRLPSVGLLSQFRTGLGSERYQALFDAVVGQARERGLVKDRLRLKDATHVIANIAVPSAIRLVAQMRARLLSSAELYAPEKVAVETERAAEIRQATADLNNEERLLHRVAHLRELVTWAEDLQQNLNATDVATDEPRQRFDDALALAVKVLAQSEDPEVPDKIVSLVDPDARRGRHGRFYKGYQLDVSLDADSEIITAVDAPPANADEAANAEVLVQREEAAQGNDVQAISMDSIGFRGSVLRTLQDPEGLGLTVYVPPQEWNSSSGPYFTPEHFQLVDEGRVCICPAEEETRTRNRNRHDTGWKFYFPPSVCVACPLMAQCMQALPAKSGRCVGMNDFTAEYRAARVLAQTEAYAQVRKEHPKIERKLAEIIRYHGGRRTRFRGQWRVTIQYLLTALVVNVKRIVKLLSPDTASRPMTATI